MLLLDTYFIATEGEFKEGVLNKRFSPYDAYKIHTAEDLAIRYAEQYDKGCSSSPLLNEGENLVVYVFPEKSYYAYSTYSDADVSDFAFVFTIAARLVPEYYLVGS